MSTRNPDLVHCIGGYSSVTFRSGSSLALHKVGRILAVNAAKFDQFSMRNPSQFTEVMPWYEASFENSKFGPWVTSFHCLLPEEILLVQKIFKDNTPPENLGEISNYR